MMMVFLKFVAPRLAGQLVGYLQRLPLPLLTFIIGLTLGVGGTAYLWIKQPSCQEKAAVAALKLEREAREVAEELVHERSQTIESLRRRVYVLQHEASTLVPDNPICDVGVDVARLLNRARSGSPENP
jgi:hypothetical protein